MENADASVGLFDNMREANLASTKAMVEDVLVELGHFLNECRVDDEAALGAWRVMKGSAAIEVSLVSREDFAHLRVVSTVMTADDSVDRAALYARLLAANHADLIGAAFALDGDRVQIVAERSTLDLDRSEVLDMIRRVETYADSYDDRLVAEFGGRRDD